ncbi:hypothetical protein DDZ13_02640 [Coraliomargarita sinensis]|uniref:Uncharacterized protein n=1 Tax=Coraliomargarita sinensis TaxID=2174842 RepID=A0A317ZHE8_9BACT|nr:hypothetical protein [Coraliomargarita sinensis]PXA04880.1 hypothetical protein DDZ13_02640 [Coraliomargarita sinensis]
MHCNRPTIDNKPLERSETTLNDTPASNLTASYRWSKDLVSFHADGYESAGSTVSFTQDPPANGMVTVTATVSGTALDRLFVHIEVAEN